MLNIAWVTKLLFILRSRADFICIHCYSVCIPTGILSLGEVILLGSKQQRAAAEDTLFTESVIMISLATLRVLNNIARLDLKILQVSLRGRVTLLRLLYLVS